MNLYDTAIRRPVFTLMLMLALVVFGVLGYQTLPINLLPSIDIPIVTVNTFLPGASPEVMESDVTDAIESAVGTIEGIDQITSYSGQGVSQVTVMFTTERDIDIAAQDVRDKVSGAVGQLPLDAEPPIVQKLDINSQPMLWMSFAGLDYRELSDYADQVVTPRLQSVPGVGNVLVPEVNPAGGWRLQPGDDPHQRRLATTRRSEQTGRRPFPEGQVEVADRDHRTVVELFS